MDENSVNIEVQIFPASDPDVLLVLSSLGRCCSSLRSRLPLSSSAGHPKRLQLKQLPSAMVPSQKPRLQTQTHAMVRDTYVFTQEVGGIDMHEG